MSQNKDTIRLIFQILFGKPESMSMAKELGRKIRMQQLGRKQRLKTERKLEELGPPPKYQQTINLEGGR